MSYLLRRDMGLHPVTIRGRTHQARVVVTATQDDIDPADVTDPASFDSPDDFQEYLEDFRRGHRVMLTVTVKALLLHLEGSDSLGACEVGNPDDLDMYLKAYGLVENALKDLAKCAEETLQQLLGE